MINDRQAILAADKEIIGEIWISTTVYDNLVTLCEVADHRFTGSEGERRARDFLLALMRQYGLHQVHAEHFEFQGWQRNSASLEVVSPTPRHFDCLALPGSPSGAIEGELLNLGHGTPGDYACLAGRIADRIVMVTNKSPVYIRRRMHRVEKYMQAVRAGAAGFIWVRDEGGHLPETGSLGWGQTAPVPGIAVSREVARALLRTGKDEPVRLRIRAENTVGRMPSSNLV
ncbi:MAG TPA: hypothetical protein DEP84_22305, partial [Chloroflexi bacterium]|nr:hypothetical protein [Chloroflexota bacterium]